MAEKKTGINHKEYNIKLLGMISANKVAEELANSSIYIHPAIIDNSPNSLCEAQIIGCPVIAANVGGISSLVEDGKTGILYPYNETHMLAFRIMELFSDRIKLNELSKNAKQVAKRRHEPDNLYNVLYGIYNEICDDMHRRKR